MGRADRNFQMGTRLDSDHTITNLSREAVHRLGIGSASANKMGTALRSLGRYLEDSYGLKDLSGMTQDQLSGWADQLAERAEHGDMSHGHGGDLVSAVNSLLRAFGMQGKNDQGIRVEQKEFGLCRGHRFTNNQTAMSRVDQERIIAWAQGKYAATGDIRYQALQHMINVSHATGMREREASRAPLGQRDYSHGMIVIGEHEGSKNNRPREYHIGDTSHIQAAQGFVKDHAHYFTRGTLISSEHGGWKEHNNFVQSAMGAARTEMGIAATYHGIRHEYAQRVYADIWEARTGLRIEAAKVEQNSKADRIRSIAERCNIDIGEARAMDKEIRLDVSECLGHGRVDVTNVYLGS